LTATRASGNLAAMIATSKGGTHTSQHYPRVLAAVLNWCAEEDSASCVMSLVHSDYAVLDILIIDNASPDGSGARLHQRFPDQHFLQTGANLGYAGGNAKASEWALERGYDYLLIINDDAEVAVSCVSLLVRALQENPTAAIASPTVLFFGTDRIWFGGGSFKAFKAMGVHHHQGESAQHVFGARGPGDPSATPVTFLSGCVMLFDCAAVRKYGSFRAEFFAYVEDLEISVRYARAGLQLLYVPAALASHKVPYPSPPDSAFGIRQRDTNRRRLIALHYQLPMKLVALAWFYPTRMMYLARFALARDWPRARAILDGMFGRIR
jgi:GT2 family glycosyltransferase